jgi:hypothetical protein
MCARIVLRPRVNGIFALAGKTAPGVARVLFRWYYLGFAYGVTKRDFFSD